MTTQPTTDAIPDLEETSPEEPSETAEKGKSPTELRAMYEHERDKRQTAEAKLQVRAWEDAGFNPAEGVGKLLADKYEGEPTKEAITAFADGYGLNAESVPKPSTSQTETMETAEDRVQEVFAASVPEQEQDLATEVAAAEADGDFATALSLKMQQLGNISQS